MPKQVKQPKDVNQLVQMEIEDSETETPEAVKDYMANIGRKGGQIGGKRRMETMTKAKRKKIAAKAAKARWAKAKERG